VKSAVRRIMPYIVVLVSLSLAIMAWAPAGASNPTSYAWGYDHASGGSSINATGARIIDIMIQNQESGDQYVGINTGLCQTGVAPCSGRVIETGIARGTLWNSEYRQYVKYVDNNGTDHVIAVDTTDLQNAYYYLEVSYNSTDVAWDVYRGTCQSIDYSTCDRTKVYSVSASDAYVGFNTGASAYAGGSGKGQMPPQDLHGELWIPQYYNSGWQGWDWAGSPDRKALSICNHTISRISSGQTIIATVSSCP
jgi:hypothetical protein